MSEHERLMEFTNEIHRAVMQAGDRGLDWRSNLATRRAYSAAIIRALRNERSVVRFAGPCGEDCMACSGLHYVGIIDWGGQDLPEGAVMPCPRGVAGSGYGA